MVTICTGWRHKHEPRTIRVDGDPSTKHSHGMCDECMADFLGQAEDPKVPEDYARYVREFPLSDPRD